MTVCHFFFFGEAIENSTCTLGAVVLPLRKDTEVERENPDPNYSTQWVKWSVVPLCCVNDSTESGSYTDWLPV